ncbi:hypothetical protein [Brevundimonas sp.]|uniref:hypothetical protein n=1 Tax=Brevundimonas sp. TaxID=1871086 RepID=UPI00289D75FE|nr:hypothetical protein [Brevundimonas sp.]
MKQNAKLWLRAANPFTPPRGMVEAERAARVGAVALAIETLSSAVSSIRTIADPGYMRNAMSQQFEQMRLPAKELELQMALFEAMRPMMAIFSLGFIVLMVVVAVVQWRKMTRIIPIIMLVYVGYSMVTTLGVLAFGVFPRGVMDGWAVFNWALFAILLLPVIASYRGATALERLKRAY